VSLRRRAINQLLSWGSRLLQLLLLLLLLPFLASELLLLRLLSTGDQSANLCGDGHALPAANNLHFFLRRRL